MNKPYSSDDIQSLSGRDHVRMRPQLYFEKCFTEQTLDALPFEVLCHAFDEYFDGNCRQITLTIAKDHFVVTYDAGMSLQKMKYEDLTFAEVIMTKVMACSNLKKHLAVGHEFCGVGMATINFASENCELTTICGGQKGVFTFENGETIKRTIKPYKNDVSSTSIYVKPLKAIFGNLALTPIGITKKVDDIHARLTSLQITVKNNIQ